MKKLITTFLLFVFLFTNLSSVFFITNAVEDAPNPCLPEEAVYENAKHWWDLDIRRTTNNFISSVLINLFASSIGTTPNIVMSCINDLEDQLQASFPNAYVSSGDTCPPPADPDVCNALTNDFSGASGYRYNTNSSIAVRGVEGSLLGYSYLMENYVRREPLPVNMAYAWNKSISKIPFANKALAASDPAENMPIIKAVYGAWTFSRNIALSLMSLVLLYTGIMIVLRKKVNAQLVVSVQYAIPKMLIGVILIIFSYVIGAFIVAVSWGLFRGGNSIVFSQIFGGGAAQLPSGVLTIALITLTLRLAQGGFFYLLLVLAVGLVLIIIRMILFFKAILIYLKMTFSILTAPLEFALGTVPGSEDRMKDWFLRMAKYGLTLLAMGIIIPITLAMALSVLSAYNSGAGSEVGGWGIIMSLLAPLIIVLFGFSLAISMDSKVEAMLSGGKKKR